MGGVLGLDSEGEEEKQAQSLLDEVYLDSVAAKEIIELIRVRSQKHEPRYGYSMEVKRLWKVKTSADMQHLEQMAGVRYGSPMQLFHGTRPNSAQNIIDHGFRLPRQPGMFGRGVYFAKDPLKSVNFAFEERPQGRSQSFWSWFWGSPAEESEPVRRMLLCDVWLGRSRTVRKAMRNFDSSKHLRRTCLMRWLGAKEYHSVRAPGGTFGAVGVTEYVVYTEEQAVPRFLIEFDKKQILRGRSKFRRPPARRAGSTPSPSPPRPPSGQRSGSAAAALPKAPPIGAKHQPAPLRSAPELQAQSREGVAITAAAAPEVSTAVAAAPPPAAVLPPATVLREPLERSEQLEGVVTAPTPTHADQTCQSDNAADMV